MSTPTVSPHFLFATSTYHQKTGKTSFCVIQQNTKVTLSQHKTNFNDSLKEWCADVEVIWVNSWRPVIGAWRRRFLGCRLWEWGWDWFSDWQMGSGLVCLGKIDAFVKKTSPFQLVCLHGWENLFGEVVEMDGAVSDEYWAGMVCCWVFFTTNGPSPKLSEKWPNHPSIQRFIARGGANKEKTVWRYLLQISSGLLWLHQNRRFRSFTFVGGHVYGGVVATTDTICFYTWWRKW